MEKLNQQIENIKFIYNKDLMTHPYHGIVSLTNRCNLNCSYCFHEQSNIDMTFEIADKAAQYLITNANIMNKKPGIGFFGGEPLLKFKDIIQPLVIKYKDIFNWSITTNGTLLTEEIINFCTKYNIDILLSMDGGNIIQNTQRPLKKDSSNIKITSFDLIKKNLSYLLLKKPNTTLRATITKFSLPYLYEIIDIANKYCFKNIALIPNGFEIWEDNDYCIWRDFVDQEAIKIMKHILLNEKLEYKFTTLLDIYNILLNQEYCPNLKNPLSSCGLGIKAIGISPQGNLFPCQENNGKSTSDSIGNIDIGIDYKKHEEYCLKYYNAWKNYVITIDTNFHGSQNFKLFFSNYFCATRLIEGYAYSNTYVFYLKALHQAASRFLYNYNFSLNPKVTDFFNFNDIEEIKEWKH